MMLMALVTVVTVIGLQSVGVLLVVALLIIPAAAARFWTHRLHVMTLAAGALGGLSAAVGVFVSALFPRLAAGAVIVLAGSALFLLSALFGSRRGVLVRWWERRRLRRQVGRTHLLRAVFERLEMLGVTPSDAMDELTRHMVNADELQLLRSWTPAQLRTLLAAAQRDGLIDRAPDGRVHLTPAGAAEACRAVRNHRLWELFLIEHADVAPSHVDRDADDIEHLLGADMVNELERLLAERYAAPAVPPSPHGINDVAPEGR
jgi:manganese/zinc/iron transport system permease protein